MEFAELALSAFQAKNNYIQQLLGENASLKVNLAEALANDVADSERITEAEKQAETAKAELDNLLATTREQDQKLVDAIQNLQGQLGIEAPLPKIPVEPVSQLFKK